MNLLTLYSLVHDCNHGVVVHSYVFED